MKKLKNEDERYEMYQKNETKKFIYTLILLFVITIGFSAAYLFADMNVENQELSADLAELASFNFFKSGDLEITANQLNLTQDGNNLSDTITLSAVLSSQNDDDYKENYYVYFEVLDNEFIYTTEEQTPEMILVVQDPEGEYVTEIEGLTYTTSGGVTGFDITTFKGIAYITEDYDIVSNNNTVTDDWVFTLYFINLDTNQKVNSGKVLISEAVAGRNGAESQLENEGINPDLCSGDNSFEEGTFQASIIENGGEVNCEEPNFSSIATTNEGIFKTTDVYGPTYYFRGAVEDNWVKFAGFYWRIIRINGDGSVKLIYSGENAPTEDQKIKKTTDTQLSTLTTFNSITSGPEHVGYTFEEGSLNNPSIKGSGDSTIKTVVDTWYETNIENKGFSTYIEDTAYCADRTSYNNTAGSLIHTEYTKNDNYFKYYIDLSTNKTPTLLCNNKKDYYTVDDTVTGNGALKYPVTIISANEAAYAGAVTYRENQNHYLCSGEYYWTISPAYFMATLAGMALVNVNGDLGFADVDFDEGGIRVVLSLNSEINTTGDGSWNSPYEILTN